MSINLRDNLCKLSLCSFLVFALTGCRSKRDISWSTQAYSSDKHWLATAHGEAGGSFGGGYEATIVYLSQAEQQPVEILEFDRLLSKSSLHLNWAGPRYLAVVIDPGTDPINSTEVHFQAIKCGDVTITLEPMPH
ncbi:hypothetical protein [Tunturiibacter gelidiferens]|uniref:Lipoprotein n=1 Tax=Tunturiibacter gelidiferens TaxID=3069689 RepID=A0AAU7YZ55_9BACT